MTILVYRNSSIHAFNPLCKGTVKLPDLAGSS